MAKNLTIGTTTTATLSLTDGSTPPVARPLPAGVVPVWSTDNAAAVTIDNSQDATGLTAVITGVADGVANINAVVTYPDGDTFTVTGQVNVIDPEDTQGTMSFS